MSNDITTAPWAWRRVINVTSAFCLYNGMDLGAAHGMPQVEVFHCRGFDDAQAGALAVRAQRVVDFVSGAIHALEGQSERLGETTFLFAPANVLLSST